MKLTLLRNDPAKIKRVARLMKTVSHPKRLEIIELLIASGRMPVKDIYEAVNISQSNASQHLKALEDVAVLSSERDGKNIFYQVENAQISKLLQCVSECADC